MSKLPEITTSEGMLKVLVQEVNEGLLCQPPETRTEYLMEGGCYAGGFAEICEQLLLTPVTAEPDDASLLAFQHKMCEIKNLCNEAAALALAAYEEKEGGAA